MGEDKDWRHITIREALMVTVVGIVVIYFLNII